MPKDWPDPSPFEFDGPLDPQKLIGRSREAASLRKWIGAGQSTVLIAPRRFGKTSLLRKVKKDSETRDRIPVIYVDALEVVSLADLVIRLEKAWAEHAPRKMRSTLAKVFAGAQVGLSVAGTGFSVALANRPDTDPLPALHTLLDLPRTMPVDRIAVVFDEFQSIRLLDGVEALLRSYVQRQRGKASYVFSGSEPSMVRAIFDDRARPLYGQAQQFELGRLNVGTLVSHVIDVCARTDRDVSAAVGDIMAVSQGHPQRAMLLAHLLWQRVRPGQSADEATATEVLAEALYRITAEAEALLRSLDRPEVKTLRVIAEYGRPLSADGARRTELPKSSAARAAETLARAGHVERTDDGTWRTVDPLLSKWLHDRYPTRP